MSNVTNIILTYDICDDFIDTVNAWLISKNHLSFGDCNAVFEDGKRVSSGDKSLETPLFVGAFNHFNVEGFVDFLTSLKWEYPESVQVFVKGQDNEIFTELRI